ncbi:MAG: hypothetical protein ACQEP1_05260 [Nanobdellota archaeon]
MKKRSQYAAEYLMVFAFSIMILVPVIFLITEETEQVKTKLHSERAFSTAQKITETALKVHYLGEGSMSRISVMIPENIKDTEIRDREVLLTLRDQGLETDIYHTSRINLTGSLPSRPGKYELKVRSEGDKVWVGI